MKRFIILKEHNNKNMAISRYPYDKIHDNENELNYYLGTLREKGMIVIVDKNSVGISDGHTPNFASVDIYEIHTKEELKQLQVEKEKSMERKIITMEKKLEALKIPALN